MTRENTKATNRYTYSILRNIMDFIGGSERDVRRFKRQKQKVILVDREDEQRRKGDDDGREERARRFCVREDIDQQDEDHLHDLKDKA